MDDDQNPQRHPDLVVWLDERAAGFERWAVATGAPERWDFSPASLDELEELVRSRFTGEEETTAARRDTFLQGAAWYVGEVVCRTKGAVWKYEAFAVGGGPLPALFASEQPGTIDTPYVGPPDEGEEAGVYPMGALHMLFWTVDEVDNPVEPHLRDVLEDPDADDEA